MIGDEGSPKPSPNQELGVSTLLQFRPRWPLSIPLILLDDAPSTLQPCCEPWEEGLVVVPMPISD